MKTVLSINIDRNTHPPSLNLLFVRKNRKSGLNFTKSTFRCIFAMGTYVFHLIEIIKNQINILPIWFLYFK
ncbi:hypothetical protein PROVRETT_09307 [Providencia rettgeri DSM 1131]|nr:hypothetical protein PROVRETT_09307 [Providencia rettgeri DSM 1131]